MQQECIDILLATYNGEKYIAEQIESIINQTYTNWRIILRDDCSTDSTMEIVLKYKKNIGERLVIIDNDNGNLGPAYNFFYLLNCSSAQYIMFCDQDDVWLPFKIEISKEKIIEYKNMPALVHTDLKVVDCNLNEKAKSYWRTDGIQYQSVNYKDFIRYNHVTGCTVIINSCLRDIALSGKVSYMIMHDWFLALLASLCGLIAFIDEPTILYRQHESNIIGIRKKNIFIWGKKLFNCNKNTSWKKSREQVKNILNLCGLNIPIKIRDELIEFSRLEIYQRRERYRWLLKNNYLAGSIINKLGQFFIC